MKCAADEVGKDADVSGSVEMHELLILVQQSTMQGDYLSGKPGNARCKGVTMPTNIFVV